MVWGLSLSRLFTTATAFAFIMVAHVAPFIRRIVLLLAAIERIANGPRAFSCGIVAITLWNRACALEDSQCDTIGRQFADSRLINVHDVIRYVDLSPVVYQCIVRFAIYREYLAFLQILNGLAEDRYGAFAVMARSRRQRFAEFSRRLGEQNVIPRQARLTIFFVAVPRGSFRKQ